MRVFSFACVTYYLTIEFFSFGRLGLKENVLNDIVNSSSGKCWSSELYNPVPGLLPDVPSSKNYEVSERLYIYNV